MSLKTGLISAWRWLTKSDAPTAQPMVEAAPSVRTTSNTTATRRAHRIATTRWFWISKRGPIGKGDTYNVGTNMLKREAWRSARNSFAKAKLAYKTWKSMLFDRRDAYLESKGVGA